MYVFVYIKCILFRPYTSCGVRWVVILVSVLTIFLKLPIWANFVDLTDLSLYYYYYYLPTLDQPTLFYSLNLNLNQANRDQLNLDLQSEHTLHYMKAGMLRNVEVEAQSTRLIEISWTLTFRVSTPYITWRQDEVEAQSTRVIEISWTLTFRVGTPYITWRQEC